MAKEPIWLRRIRVIAHGPCSHRTFDGAFEFIPSEGDLIDEPMLPPEECGVFEKISLKC